MPRLPAAFIWLEDLSQTPESSVMRARLGDREVVVRMEASAESQTVAELEVLAAVHHPGIAELVEHGPLEDGGRFSARSWIPGEPLSVWAQARSQEEIGAVVAALCPALEHLHTLGFVHADLKPENVIVNAEGVPVLTDFGLAQHRGAGSQNNGVSGSLFSIAPEVLLGTSITPSADLFALGTLLHRLLTHTSTSPREFYGRFPQRSFLDAIGSSPQDLPEWARDLVVALTARDPARRPESAMEVGRRLGERLGLPPQDSGSATRLRWPVGFGRESWCNAWLAHMAAEEESGSWIEVPHEENPHALWQHLRLFAALRGTSTRGLDLDKELARLESTLQLDEWGRRQSELAGPLLVCMVERTPWMERALEVLSRARTQAATSGAMCVICPTPPVQREDGEWEHLPAPPVDERSISRFLSRALRAEQAERRDALAARLADACGGSATRVQEMLDQCIAHGLFFGPDSDLRMRPGEVASWNLALPDVQAGEGFDSVSDDGVLLASALLLAGGRASVTEATATAGLTPARAAEAVLELAKAHVARVEREPESQVVARAHLHPPSAERREQVGLGSRGLRAAHERRAAYLEARELRPLEALCHRALAEEKEPPIRELLDALELLRDRGCPERVLETIDTLERLLAWESRSIEQLAPELCVERARAWTLLGQYELALNAVQKLADQEDRRLRSMVELVRARVDEKKLDTDSALQRFDRAEELDPGVSTDALLGRAHVLSMLGRDEELVELVEHAQPSSAAHASPSLAPRQRAYLESLAAWSSFRLGRVAQAREATLRLLAESRTLGDTGREAALSINLATIERRTGSATEARAILERAVELYDRAGMVAGLAAAQRTLGGVLRDLGELLEAEQHLFESGRCLERLGDTTGAALSRGMLGLVAFERGHALSAIATLEGSVVSLSPAERRRFSPLLSAKADEMHARIGHAPRAESVEDAADPRVLLSRASACLMRGKPEEARALALRAAQLAGSLGLVPLESEARLLSVWIDGPASAHEERDSAQALGVLAHQDREARRLLAHTGAEFDERAAQELAVQLAAQGRDDRAARMFVAVSARTQESECSAQARLRALECFEACAAGLTDPERDVLRKHLLGTPEPWPGDLTQKHEDQDSDGEFAMEVDSLIEINRRLLDQDDLEPLLSAIVDSALSVTGAERGFFVLEERGELRFDTAIDSCHGDIDLPEFEVSRSVVSEALERMQPLCVSNAVEDPLLANNTSVVSLELRSILCVPIEIGAEIRGVIYLDHRLRTGAFDERSERLCTLLASQAALAIQQVRRLAEIRSLNRKLERRVLQQESDLRSARTALRRARVGAAPGGLVGDSAAMQSVYELLRKTAPSKLSVLVRGESGTGKELAARSLHELSARAAGPFVSENCAAIPASLIESELFGYKRGAFTGAEKDHPGIFEEASGGTLFLDEIAEMPLELQAKLLRVLESGEVRRLGESRTRSVDVRLVVATNRPIEEDVREGRFREDLYYRLDGLRVEMPPLAERTEDIVPLVRHFLRLEEEREGVHRSISKEVLTRLARRPWPGNVRELKNEVARLCVLSVGDIDDPELVRAPVRRSATTSGHSATRTLAEIEKETILDTLDAVGGDKRRAAEVLGISRAKVYQKLKQWSSDQDSATSKSA